MHMGLQDKLQHFAAPADAYVVAIEGALTGDAVVDAHVKAMAAGQKLTIVHEGAPTPVALRMATRFGATLVDAATIALPEETILLPPSSAQVETPAPVVEAPTMPIVEAPVVEAPIVATPPALDEQLIVAASEPAPEVAHAPEAPPLLEEGTLPWTIAVAEEKDATDSTLTLPEDEFEAMPWNVVHTQIISSGRKTRLDTPRPTTAPDWGLPWPRPVAPTDGLAVADPKLWHAQERLRAVRDDLDLAGAPSFGVAKPDAQSSAWLKRLHDFGSP